MSDPRAFLVGLQLADSALPVGRYAHSFGLEALLRDDEHVTEAAIVEIVKSMLIQSAGPLDGVAVAQGHRAESRGDLQALFTIDRMVTARKLTAGSRQASVSCGRQLAALSVVFLEGEQNSGYCASVRAGQTDGNLAVVGGSLASALGMECEQAVLVELKGIAAGAFSAALRLGRISAARAQVGLRSCEEAIVSAAEEALTLPRQAMLSTLPELEIYAMLHERLPARLFIT